MSAKDICRFALSNILGECMRMCVCVFEVTIHIYTHPYIFRLHMYIYIYIYIYRLNRSDKRNKNISLSYLLIFNRFQLVSSSGEQFCGEMFIRPFKLLEKFLNKLIYKKTSNGKSGSNYKICWLIYQFYIPYVLIWVIYNICKVKLATIVEGDPKAPFSIATTPRCRGGRYSIPRIAPLYPWTVPYNAEC